jgi:hypothetical protein
LFDDNDNDYALCHHTLDNGLEIVAETSPDTPQLTPSSGSAPGRDETDEISGVEPFSGTHGFQGLGQSHRRAGQP